MNQNKIVFRAGSLLVAVLLLATALVLFPINTVASGIEPTANWGSDENGIYSIATTADMLAFAANAEANGWYRNRIVQLTANIDMSGVSWTTPEKFRGFFEGNGYAISNLTLENSESELAFVGTLDGATFRNVQFINGSVTITGDDVHLAGVIAVSVDGADCTFENVYTKMTLTTPTTVSCRAGGMVAYVGYGSNATFTNCLSECTLSGYKALGGFVGATGCASNVSFTNCVFAGAIIRSNSETGGFIGRAVGNASLTRCVSLGMNSKTGRQHGSLLSLDTLDFEEGDQSLQPASTVVIEDCYVAHANTNQLAVGAHSVRNNYSVTVKYTGTLAPLYSVTSGEVDPSAATNAIKKLALNETVSLMKESFTLNYPTLAMGLVATDETAVYGTKTANGITTDLTVCKIIPATVADMLDGDFTAGPLPEMPEDPAPDQGNSTTNGAEGEQPGSSTQNDTTSTFKTVPNPNVALIVICAVGSVAVIAAAVILILKNRQLVMRIVCAALAVVMVAGGVVGIVLSATRTSEIEEKKPSVPDNLINNTIASKVPSDLTFVGEEVRILVPYDNEFDVDENSTAVIDQAFLERNEAVEARLGIELSYLVNEGSVSSDHLTNIRTSIMSGTNSYDMVGATAYYGAALAAEGLYYNLNSDHAENYISSDLAWYNQSFVKETSYKNILYYIVGDLTTSSPDRTPVTYFNEDLLNEWSIDEDLYALALDGKWTIEVLKTLVKEVYHELDGVDGKTKGDLHGLFFNGGSMNIDAIVVSAGINLSTTDADGNIRLSYMDGNAVDAFEAVYKLMYETDGVFLGTVGDDSYYGDDTGYYSEQAFFEKRAIFAFGQIRAAKVFATDVTLHYSMLPMPKYSEEQESYATTPQDGYTILSIPYNVGNRMGLATATLEMLSEYSYSILRPVYYDVAYKTRYASSEDTARLFDTVIDSITFNFVTLYSNSLEDPVKLMRARLLGDGSTEPSSNLNRFKMLYDSQIQTKLDKLLEEFDH